MSERLSPRRGIAASGKKCLHKCNESYKYIIIIFIAIGIALSICSTKKTVLQKTKTKSSITSSKKYSTMALPSILITMTAPMKIQNRRRTPRGKKNSTRKIIARRKMTQKPSPRPSKKTENPPRYRASAKNSIRRCSSKPSKNWSETSARRRPVSRASQTGYSPNSRQLTKTYVLI